MDDFDGFRPEAVLEVGHRLSKAPSELLIGAAFADEVETQAKLSDYIGLVDLAHTLTLHESEAIPHEPAQALIAALLELHENRGDFQADARLGDLYTNREAYLAARCTASGWLGVARARRETLITAYHLHLRNELVSAVHALSGLGAEMARLGSRHAEDLMPDYTYLQAAQPTSFGHYISAFSSPVLRDLERLQNLHDRANLCPAGCGSMNGSVIYQNRAAQARRLGFAAPVAHARDAMWQADTAIEAMSCAVASAVGMDRLAEDMMVFASAEFGFVRLSDRHSRASKIMPQKRNPFALAYIRGLANRLIGEQAGVAASGRTLTGQMDSRSLPYVAVPRALGSVSDAASLLAELLSEMAFDKVQAETALASGSCCASDLAERLCLDLRISFRDAHGVVGRLVTQLEEQDRTLSELTEDELRAACRALDPEIPPPSRDLIRRAMSPRECLEARSDIGGAAPKSLRRHCSEREKQFRVFADWSVEQAVRNQKAEDQLLSEARSFLKEK